MKKTFILSLFFILTSRVFAADLTVFTKSVNSGISEDRYKVCMNYQNNSKKDHKICDLKVQAVFREAITGFSKSVTDRRRENIYAEQIHEICFDFLKDEYNLWKISNIGKPVVSCVNMFGGSTPDQNCDVSKSDKCDPIDVNTQDNPTPTIDWGA